MEREIDNFALDCYRNCPAYYNWRIIKGLIKPGEKKIAASFGSAFHSGLQVWYENNMSSESKGDAIAKFIDEFALAESVEDDKRTLAKGLDILNKYYQRYEPEPYDVVKAEVGISFELGEWLYKGRIDLIMEERGTRAIYGFDHKTTSDLSRTVVKPHCQITGYVYGLVQQYENVLGYMLNMIGVYKTDKRRDKDSGHLVERDIFLRIPTSRSLEELDEWKRETLWYLHQVEESLEHNIWPKHAPSYCQAYRGRCPYLDLCNVSTPDMIERMIEAGLYVIEPWKAYEPVVIGEEE